MTTLQKPDYLSTIQKRHNPAEAIFSQIADKRGAAWLDSSLLMPGRGTISIIARNPVEIWTIVGDQVKRKSLSEGNSVTINSPQPLTLLEETVKKRQLTAIGFIDYESTLHALELLPTHNSGICHQFMLYQSVLEIDHISGEIKATQPELDDYSDLLENYENKLSTKKQAVPARPVSIRAAIDKATYLEKVRIIKEHIYEGDIYQANFTTRFDVASDEEPFEVYKRLRRLNPAPLAAFINFGDLQILSSSPERMFKRSGDFITSGPIKGTIARGDNESETEANKNKLLASVKDRAELLMIVDLVRNDLGKIAKTGSVKVTELFRPEIYSSLIHLVSDIEARLKPDITLSDIVSALLPGGSITGAPKKRAVEILNGLEAVPRSVYTGSIGYLNSDSAEFNIAIRTIEHRDQTFSLHAGGGIVADSDPEAEYDEMLLKAKNLMLSVGLENINGALFET